MAVRRWPACLPLRLPRFMHLCLPPCTCARHATVILPPPPSPNPRRLLRRRRPPEAQLPAGHLPRLPGLGRPRLPAGLRRRRRHAGGGPGRLGWAVVGLSAGLQRGRRALPADLQRPTCQPLCSSHVHCLHPSVPLPGRAGQPALGRRLPDGLPQAARHLHRPDWRARRW